MGFEEGLKKVHEQTFRKRLIKKENWENIEGGGCGVLGEEFEIYRGSQNVGDENMPQENYQRIRKGYDPKEPTNTFSFYKKLFCKQKPLLKI